MSSDGDRSDRGDDRPADRRGERDGPWHGARRDGGRVGQTATDDRGAIECARPPLFPAIELEHSIVRYRDRPDRCTLFPPDASGVARLSTWLTVDTESLCPLEEWR